MYCLWGNIENKGGFKTAHKIHNKIGKTTKDSGPQTNHGLLQPAISGVPDHDLLLPGQIHQKSGAFWF